ncbi:cephalotocin receptor 1-like isoform X2 [Copidosoma floridanum]|uniref:cephalotocin receptor 1-like isoform X2 n=1 Tax=Copidosoma floridanum TaxID=29053 RepID=UPI0006C943C1|nr:cephalotocin receptor 1-like isoform X2 [Copidosoma floridanum]
MADLMEVTTTTGTGSKGEDWRDEDLAFWEVALLGFILAVSVVSNGLVLFAIYLRRYRGRRHRLTRMHFFVMHLSIADLTTGLLNVLPQLAWDITYRFKGGDVLCKMVKFGQPLGSYLSSYILIATAVDRYHAICFPLSYCRTTSRRSRVMVYSAWVLALILCVPQVFIFSLRIVSAGVWDCWATFTGHGQKIYVTWYSLTVFLVPFSVLSFTYTRICCSIWRNRDVLVLGNLEKQQQQALSNQARNQHALISKAKMSTVKQTLAVVILYAASSLPFIGCQLWATWVPGAAESPFYTGPAFTILSLLSSLTSCVNPWIYLVFSRELRVSLIKFLHHLVKRNRSSSSGKYTKIC